ncbi:hypothetical protein [Brevibacterium oceani]|uniref:hypothetical protein n=1 Tax=Brevibacterium oceani TaxID=358099 RepID=UPI001B31A36D|nr:hypothetical protein [Brevibacterium oceani]
MARARHKTAGTTEADAHLGGDDEGQPHLGGDDEGRPPPRREPVFASDALS